MSRVMFGRLRLQKPSPHLTITEDEFLRLKGIETAARNLHGVLADFASTNKGREPMLTFNVASADVGFMLANAIDELTGSLFQPT